MDVIPASIIFALVILSWKEKNEGVRKGLLIGIAVAAIASLAV